MAKEDEKKPKSTDKGKEKAVNGDADKKEVQKDKDGKPIDDKKGAPQPGMSTYRSSATHHAITSADDTI